MAFKSAKQRKAVMAILEAIGSAGIRFGKKHPIISALAVALVGFDQYSKFRSKKAEVKENVAALRSMIAKKKKKKR